MTDDSSSERVDDSVLVHVDGKAVYVPRNVDTHWAARGALGVPRGLSVAYEFTGHSLTFQIGHEFHEGDRYEILGFAEWLERQDEDAYEFEDDRSDEPWNRGSNWWRD